MRDAGAQVRPDHATARRSEGDAPSRCLGNGRKRSISAAPLQNTRQTDLVGSLGLKSDRLLDAPPVAALMAADGRHEEQDHEQIDHVAVEMREVHLCQSETQVRQRK